MVLLSKRYSLSAFSTRYEITLGNPDVTPGLPSPSGICPSKVVGLAFFPSSPKVTSSDSLPTEGGHSKAAGSPRLRRLPNPLAKGGRPKSGAGLQKVVGLDLFV